jgi:hypothetical protein
MRYLELDLCPDLCHVPLATAFTVGCSRLRVDLNRDAITMAITSNVR